VGKEGGFEQAAVGRLLLLFLVFQSAVSMKKRSTKSLDWGRVKLYCCSDYVKGNQRGCMVFWVGAKHISISVLNVTFCFFAGASVNI